MQNLFKVVGQGYNGASSMPGMSRVGLVRAIIRQTHPENSSNLSTLKTDRRQYAGIGYTYMAYIHKDRTISVDGVIGRFRTKNRRLKLMKY